MEALVFSLKNTFFSSPSPPSPFPPFLSFSLLPPPSLPHSLLPPPPYLSLLRAISNPNSEHHQTIAWRTVCPLVVLLRKFYEYALELESALCELLSVLCSPDLNAVQHLEMKQVGKREDGGGEGVNNAHL